MGTVTTSIVVQFSQGASGQLSAEIDSRPEGHNSGKTSFAPGETAHFLVFKSDDVTIDQLIASYGAVSYLGEEDFDVEDEWLQFADTNEANLSKPYASGFSFQWYGTNLGTLTPVGNKVTCPTKGVGMAKVSYTARCRVYALPSPSQINGSSNFQILVLVKGHS